MTARFHCLECDAAVRARIPKNGDGSEHVSSLHICTDDTDRTGTPVHDAHIDGPWNTARAAETFESLTETHLYAEAP